MLECQICGAVACEHHAELVAQGEAEAERLRGKLTELQVILSECIGQIEADHTHLMGDHEGALDDPEVIDLVNKAKAASWVHTTGSGGK